MTVSRRLLSGAMAGAPLAAPARAQPTRFTLKIGSDTQRGMIFNQPDTAAFKQQLRTAGFYAEWRANFGDAAWTRLEEVTGALS